MHINAIEIPRNHHPRLLPTSYTTWEQLFDASSDTPSKTATAISFPGYENVHIHSHKNFAISDIVGYLLLSPLDSLLVPPTALDLGELVSNELQTHPRGRLCETISALFFCCV